MKCYHHNDADGRCAAAIVNLTHKEDIEFIEMDYAKKVDIEAIREQEEVIIVDFSFKPDVMAKVLKRTEKITWIDHHKTAKDYDYGRMLRGVRVFAEPGLSGAYLTWQYFVHESEMSIAVRLVSDYDTWQHKLSNDIEFNLGLTARAWSNDPTAPQWKSLFDDEDFVKELMVAGEIIAEYRTSKCEDYCRSYGYETEIGGHKAYAVNLYTFGSHTFGKRMKEYEICGGYVFDGKMFTVSLYSDLGVDTSVISKSYGGGGHSAASGFQCVELPFRPINQ